MGLKKFRTLLAMGALLIGAMLSTPALAQINSGFSALQGVEAQALSSQEMAAITGELNALDIAADLTALAGTLDKYPRLKASVLTLATYYTTNAESINNLFKRLGVYTAPK